MDFLAYIKIFVIGLLFLIVVDFIWISVLMGGFYKSQLGDMAKKKGDALRPNIPAAVLVWALIVAGIMIFVLPKVPADAILLNGFLWGALFGLVAYGIYDLTNFALLEKWSLTMTVIDMAWGCLVCGLSSVFIGYLGRIFLH